MLFKTIHALHMKFSSCRNYWGGGERQNDDPNIFMGASAPLPPPPRFDASRRRRKGDKEKKKKKRERERNRGVGKEEAGEENGRELWEKK